MAARAEAETPRQARERKGGQVDRREVILEAAARRFAEYGFGATTGRQIADDVNILSGSLYHHFAAREEMLDGVVHDAAMDQRERALRIARMDADAKTKLVTLIADQPVPVAAATR